MADPEIIELMLKYLSKTGADATWQGLRDALEGAGCSSAESTRARRYLASGHYLASWTNTDAIVLSGKGKALLVEYRLQAGK